MTPDKICAFFAQISWVRHYHTTPRCLNCAILVTMSGEPHFWQTWAQTLHHWGGGELVAMLLEAAGPLTFIGAQVVYLGQPLLGHVFSQPGLKALAELLEDPHQAQAFAVYLRQNARGTRD